MMIETLQFDPIGRRRGGFCALVLSLALGACSDAPDFAFADGSPGNWDEWQGQWLVINYWAEWCAPCRKEIPELNALQRDGAEQGVIVLGVNFDGLTGGSLDRVIEQMGVEFPVLTVDPRERWDLPAPTVLPSTLLIGPDGELKDVLVGPQTYESLARAVELTVEV